MQNFHLEPYQDNLTDLLDTEKYLETMNHCLGKAIDGFDWFLSLMGKGPQWDMVTASLSTFQPMSACFCDTNRPLEDYMRMIGWISLDAYRLLETRNTMVEKEREEQEDKITILKKEFNRLKAERNALEKIKNDQKNRIVELKRSVTGVNKSKAKSEKSLKAQKSKLSEQKKLHAKLSKEMTVEKKRTEKMMKELASFKELVKTLKKDLAVKENSLKAKQAAKD